MRLFRRIGSESRQLGGARWSLQGQVIGSILPRLPGQVFARYRYRHGQIRSVAAFAIWPSAAQLDRIAAKNVALLDDWVYESKCQRNSVMVNEVYKGSPGAGRIISGELILGVRNHSIDGIDELASGADRRRLRTADGLLLFSWNRASYYRSFPLQGELRTTDRRKGRKVGLAQAELKDTSQSRSATNLPRITYSPYPLGDGVG